MGKAICSISDCDVTVHCRGWCRLHYARWQRNGDPMIRNAPRLSAEERFWVKVAIGQPDECWMWLAGKDSHGYGVFSIRGQGSPGAHRFAYEATKGPIPQGLHLDHLCRTPACVNPNHLEPVTPRENTMRSPIASAAKKARQTHCVHGHELSGDNLYIVPSTGSRSCRACSRERKARRRSLEARAA